MQAIIEFIVNLFQTHSISWFVGQAFGIFAIIFGFVSYQVKTQRQLLVMQSAVALLFCIHYFLLGAYTGMAMNIVALIRNVVYERFCKKDGGVKLVPYVFIVILCGIAIFTWEAWYSIFVVLGIAINTYCMSFKNPQNVRKSIFVSSPLVLIYNVFSLSIGGIIYETVAIVSSFIGVLRNTAERTKTDTELK